MNLLIIAEKPTAGLKIAQHLSNYLNSDFEECKFEYKGITITYYTVGDKIFVVPLEGHVIDVKLRRGTDYPRFEWDIGLKKKRGEKGDNLRREARFKLLKQLSKGAVVVGATDNDEEGEVMLYYTARALGLEPENLPRMRFVELTYEEITRAYERALSGEKLDMGMAMAGHYRHLSDLFVGINISALLSKSAVNHGSNQQIMFHLGRVKIPLLRKLKQERTEIMKEPEIREDREAKKESDSEPEYVVKVYVDFYGLHFVDEIKAEPDEIPEIFSSEWKARVIDVKEEEEDVEPIREVYNTNGILEEVKKHGINPIKAQNEILEYLYQNEYISYPRTPSTKLPRHIDFKRRIEEMSKQIDWIDPDDFLEKIPDELLVEETEKHAGIYPIRVPPSTLPPDYLITWELIARKFFTALAKPAKREKTIVTIKVYRDGLEFGEVEAEFWEYSYLGWMKYDKEFHSSEFTPDVKVGEEVKVKLSIDTRELYGGYTGSLSIRKEIGEIKRMDIGELLRWMERVKLGTEATRVEHIAELRKHGYIEGEDKVAITTIGQKIAEICENLIPIDLKDTREIYEHMNILKHHPELIAKIIEIVKEKVVKIYENVNIDEVGRELNNLGNCPNCGKPCKLVYFNGRYFIGCSGYPDCKFLLSIS